MTKDHFRLELRKILDSHLAQAVQQVHATLDNVPANARELIFEVIPSQDAEGQFDVMACLSGPDLYVLNKAIRGSSRIFGVRHSATGFVPPVPMVDPDAVDFDVNDAIVDVVAEWLRVVWTEVRAPAHGIPVRVEGHDGYGTIPPVHLRG